MMAIAAGINEVTIFATTVIIFVITGNNEPTSCAIIGAIAAASCPIISAICTKNGAN